MSEGGRVPAGGAASGGSALGSGFGAGLGSIFGQAWVWVSARRSSLLLERGLLPAQLLFLGKRSFLQRLLALFPGDPFFFGALSYLRFLLRFLQREQLQIRLGPLGCRVRDRFHGGLRALHRHVGADAAADDGDRGDRGDHPGCARNWRPGPIECQGRCR